jgi:predicted aspartyl protease
VEKKHHVFARYVKPVYFALIDTGASMCAISNSIISEINVYITGKIVNELIDGTKSHSPEYTADMFLLDMEGNNIYDIFSQMKASVIDMTNKPFQIILGQNALDRLVLRYDGPKREFTLEF